MKVLIVDDEGLARERLQRLLEGMDEAQVSGTAGDGREALEKAAQLQPDVVLMDIRMPGMDGLEAARHLAELEQGPAVIFTTAFGEHALEAFEARAVDYLLKPIRKERLLQALQAAQRVTRAQADQLRQETAAPVRGHVCARVRGGLQLVSMEDVRCFRAEHKYVTVVHTGGEVLIEDSLKSLEEEFGERLIRVHRNALVVSDKLLGLEKNTAGQWVLRLQDIAEPIEVSRRQLPEIRQYLRERGES